MSFGCAHRNGLPAVRGWVVGAASALVIFAGCGESDEKPAPASAASDPVAVVQQAAERTLRAGSSTARIEVVGRSSYALEETLDTGSRWYLANSPPVAPGVKLSVRRPPITGPAFDFGASDVNRAFVRSDGLGRRSCWVEAHDPAGNARGAVSVEEALVTLHTALVLLDGNVATAERLDTRAGYRARIDPPDFEDTLRAAVAPNVDVTNAYVRERQRSGSRIIRGIQQPVVVELDGDGNLTTLSLLIRGGRSPLTFTGRRPSSKVTLTFTGIGDGEPVRPPKCTAIE